MNILMILNGPPVTTTRLREFAQLSDFIIAADGGAKTCLEACIKPDLVIGDMDSVEMTNMPHDWKIKPISDQETTDFEKALVEIHPLQPTRLIVTGGLGGRVDHELTNLLIASRLNPEWSVEFHSNNATIYRCLSNLTLSLPVGDTLSLVPWPEAGGVTTTGFAWNLSRQVLSAKQKLGQSNRITNSPVTIMIESGAIYVIHPTHLAQNGNN